jgi:hypothetical protein
MVIGAILVSTGMLSVLYVEKAEAERWVAAGLLTLIGGAAIGLVGYALTVTGVVAVVGGAGTATEKVSGKRCRFYKLMIKPWMQAKNLCTWAMQKVLHAQNQLAKASITITAHLRIFSFA